METLAALLTLGDDISLAPKHLPHKKPEMQSFNIFPVVSLNKLQYQAVRQLY